MTKRSIALILALVVAFAFSAIAVAQTTAPKTAGESQPKAAAVKTHTMKGSVVSVDAIANTIVVKGKKAEQTFQVDPAAKIVLNKKEVKLADVKKDTKVVVTYKEVDSKKVAVGIK
jgi:hypothetical protein